MTMHALILDTGDDFIPPVYAAAPVDLDGELRLVATCITSRPGAELAVERGVHAFAFTNRVMARLFTIATECEVVGIDARIDAIAATSGLPREYIARLEITPRIGLVDGSGHYANRVLSAYTRRSRFEELAAELEELAQ